MILDFKKAETLLREYGIPVLETRIVKSRKEVKKTSIFPCCLKADGVLHRKGKGLIELDIKDRKELLRAFKKIRRIHEGDFLIQRMVKGVEIFCGCKRDKTFGIILMFGLGGIFVEVIKDIQFGIAPLTKKEALEMIKGIKGQRILRGYRGEEVSINILGNILIQLSKLMTDHPEIKSIDLNPIIKEKVIDVKIIF